MNRFIKSTMKRISEAASTVLVQDSLPLDARVEFAICEALASDENFQFKLRCAAEKTESTMDLVVAPLIKEDLSIPGWILVTKQNMAKVAEFGTFVALERTLVQAALGEASVEFKNQIKNACARVMPAAH